MKPLNAALVGLLVGVVAMWFGGDKLKALVARDSCGCPNPGASAGGGAHADHGTAGEDDTASADIKCPAHFDGGEIVVDDKPALMRVRIAMRDGVYALWTELGRAPTKEELAERLKLDAKQTDELMDTLQACGEQMGGGILKAPQSDLIAIAWPFSNLPTGITVTVDGSKPANARCAVDALGVSQMLGKKTTIDAAAHDNNAKIHLVIDGETVVEAEPKDLVVYKGGSCDEMLFFSSPAAVDEWQKKNNVTGGELMTLADATKHGAELFGRITAGLPTPADAAAYLASAGKEPQHVAPWEPVDEAFRGCEGGCGERAQTGEAGVIVQATTAAKIGDKVFCPVSGVVFTVTDKSPQREVAGKKVFFCCESCAAYFSANAARVEAARGFGAT